MKSSVEWSHRARFDFTGAFLRCLGLLLLCALASGCGDGDNPPAKVSARPSPPKQASGYSVKGYLVAGDKRTRVDFAPSTYWEEAKVAGGGKIVSKGLTPPPQMVQGIKNCAGTDCTDLPVEVQGAAAGQLFDGETLLLAVTQSCVADVRAKANYTAVVTFWPAFAEKLQNVFDHPGEQSYVDALPHVWEPGAWFTLPGTPASVGCDQILARQEVLLCTSNRLVQVADAVTTTKIDFSAVSHWEFPVQEIQDKFILRDLALRTLGNLAALETRLPAAPETYGGALFEGLRTCSDIYVRAAVATDSELTVPEGQYSPFTYATYKQDGWLELPKPDNLAHGRLLMAERANYKTNILRAANRLARELLDESIEADVAGAEKRKAQAGDPVEGLRLMWGADRDAADSSFNSIRHALAILYGHLDIVNPDAIVRKCESPTRQAPKLDPYGVMDVLGNGFSARWADIPPQTSGQSLALSLVGQTGLLVPEGTHSDAEVSTAVAEQLLRVAAAARGVEPAEFALSGGGQALMTVFEKVNVADLRFALARNRDAYRMLADVSASANTFPDGGYLEFEDEADLGPGVLAVEGRVLKGGIPRTDLHLDMLGLSGRAQISGQCGEFVGLRTDATFAKYVGGGFDKEASTQSVFTLGQALSHQLNQIAAGFSTVSGASAGTTVKNARAGAAEARTWAGPGSVIVVDAPDAISFNIVGLKPADIGAKDVASMASRLALVRLGRDEVEPWKPDCVAGIRKSCPADLSSLEVPFSTAITTIPSYDPYATIEVNGVAFPKSDLAGFVGPYLSLTVTNSSDPDDQDSYALIERPRGDKAGRVLATILTGTNADTGGGWGQLRIEVISDYQRTLVNEVLGTGNPARHGSTCGDVTSTALPDSYCISGMKRDMFVPLSNELTSEGGQQEDSWKHYLSLAQAAAAHADDLGQQVIRAGEDRELRREGAQESLGDVCGTFANVDSLKVTDGDIESGPADAALAACVDPPKVDLVFLTDDKFPDPTKAADKAAVDEQIREAYCPEDAAAANPKFCTDKDPTSDEPGKRYITHRAMGLKTYVPQGSTSSCDEILKLAESATASDTIDAATGSALSALASQPWITHAGLFAGFGGIQLTVRSSTDEDGEILWEGRRYDKRILGPKTLFDAGDEAAKAVYPACDEMGVGCVGSAELMRKVFNPTGLELTSTQVRRRIEAALFHLGAMVGVVPAETFSVQVPVYNANIDSDPVNPNQGTEAPAIYGDATFDSNGPIGNRYYTLAIEPTNPVRDEDESIALGHALPADATYWAARKAEEHEQTFPAVWRKNLYDAANAAAATTGTYAVVEGKNPALMFDRIIQGSTAISRADNIQEWLRDFGSDMAQGCRAWPDPGMSLGLYSYADVFPRNRWNNGHNADMVQQELQRNICASAVNPVFYENVMSRQLHLRAFAWHAVGGTKAFKDIIEDLDHPNDAMHKERAAFFEPFSKCAVGSDSAFFPESCIRRKAYTESHSTLLDAVTSSATLLDYVPLGSISGEGNFRRAVENRLQPSVCSPGARAELFINRYPDDSCGVAQAVVQGLALACVMSDEPVAFQAGEPPPAIDGPESLPIYEAWLSMLELQVGAAVNQGFFTDFPAAVLDRNSGASGFTASLGSGAQGTAMLDLADHVEAMHSSWSSLAGALRDLRSSVRGFRLELSSLDNEQKKRRLAEHSARLRLTQEIVVSSIQAAAAAAKVYWPGKDPVAGRIAAVEQIGIAATNITFAALQLNVLDDQGALGDDGDKISQDRAAFSFSQEATRTFDTLDQAVIGIRTSSNQILASLNLIANNRQKASWELAKVSGADFAEIDGAPVAQNVNTVLNRQYNVLRIRYDKALESAKRAAYLARLSIEQRIGVRLNDLRQPIGPIDSPANWVDDLCSVQGIDYEKLRLADPDSPTFNDDTSATIQGFANQFVGDYVAKLQEFIEFYNIEFPFRQADDQAVLSLREDLLRPDAQCSVQSPNELYYSDRLFTGGQTGENFESRQGWQATGCVEDGCMYAKDGSGLQDANGGRLLPPNGVGGISWLKVTDTPPFADPDEGPLGVAIGDPLPDSPAPFGTVYQTVPLRAGRFYVLSWWDMARAADGGPFSGTPQAYFVGIYDKEWRLLALSSPVAGNGGADGDTWSARRELSVTSFDDGDYHIVFGPSELGERPASLAIANVQLEEPDKNLASASTYFRTEASRTIINTECKQVTSEQLRKAFTRRCEGGRADGKAETCYYELNRDIVLDAEQLDAGFGGLVGRVGRDNYNTRHVDLALNLVGTGVLDCSGTDSAACYGAGFVEYDLQHIAFNAPIVDYDRATHCFNFAEGAVRSGKALATERYLTLPLGSADESLLAQPAFRKTELFGRPLSGLYKLRIRDNPALVWQNLEDIQVLLGYRYWSRVAKPETSR